MAPQRPGFVVVIMGQSAKLLPCHTPVMLLVDNPVGVADIFGARDIPGESDLVETVAHPKTSERKMAGISSRERHAYIAVNLRWSRKPD
jgi:hypothetical protein